LVFEGGFRAAPYNEFALAPDLAVGSVTSGGSLSLSGRSEIPILGNANPR
jgi:hypothetical protein